MIPREGVAVEDFAVVAAEAVVVGAPRVIGVDHIVVAFGEIRAFVGVECLNEFGVVIGKHAG